MQKYLLTKGFGLSKTVIVGINERGFQVANDIGAHDQQGFDWLLGKKQTTWPVVR